MRVPLMTGFPTRMSGSTIILFSNSSTLIHLHVLIRYRDYNVAQLYFNYQQRIVRCDLQVELKFHDVSATLLTENAQTTVQPHHQENLNQTLKNPKRKNNNRTTIAASSHDNKLNFENGRKRNAIIMQGEILRILGKKDHLCEYEADSLADDLKGLFERKVEIPRIKHGKKQTLDTLISEEAWLLAKFLRNEQKEWNPRIPTVKPFSVDLH